MIDRPAGGEELVAARALMLDERRATGADGALISSTCGR